MTRVKSGPTKHARHKKVLARTSGFRMTKNRLYHVAHEAYIHALDYAFHGRKLRKRDFRSLWIVRINAGLRAIDPSYSYSTFINGLRKAKIELSRKTLSELAISHPQVFAKIVDKTQK